MSDYSELKQLLEYAESYKHKRDTPADVEKFCRLTELTTTDKLLALIAENECLQAVAGYYDGLHSERDQLKAENEALRKDRTDWQSECLKRGFEYVRESDDHYVLADLPEMADLLGLLLGVEVRTKDNDAYEEANSRLNEQVEGLINTIHAQESLRKDAERYRWTCIEGNWVARVFGKWRAHVGEYGDANPTDWYPSRGEAIDAAMSLKVDK